MSEATELTEDAALTAEVAEQEISAHQVTPAPAAPAPIPFDMDRGMVFTDADQLGRFAQGLIQTGMAPKGVHDPRQIIGRIQHGLEVGFTVMQSIHNIAMINGTPTIWGDGLMALAMSTGEMTGFEESSKGNLKDGTYTAICKVTRGTITVTEQFGIEDAKLAGLWDAGVTWKKYPKRMLQMRARAFALRAAFADRLKGLYSREEMLDVTGTTYDVEPSHQQVEHANNLSKLKEGMKES